MTLQAIGLAVRRWQAVIIDTVVVAIVTALVIFKGNFYTDLTGFLLYIVVWLAPWFAIVMVDYLLRRGRYDPLLAGDRARRPLLAPRRSALAGGHRPATRHGWPP